MWSSSTNRWIAIVMIIYVMRSIIITITDSDKVGNDIVAATTAVMNKGSILLIHMSTG